MKKVIACILLFILTANACLKSQDIPPPNPSLALNIVSNAIIDFDFDEFDKFVYGIGSGSPYTGPSTFIRILAIYDWKLQFSADQPTFVAVSGNTMDLDNLGVTISSTGTNTEFNGHITNNATVPVGLTYNLTDAPVLLTKGSLTNKGGGIENSFVLYWHMGIMQGTMNPQSMLDQMTEGYLEADDYTVTVVLTLSVY
jgi:hypothetical protein